MKYLSILTLLAAAITIPSKITFQASGTGSVSRKLSDKLSDVVSVLDYGADLTGVADSSTAFTNALAAIFASNNSTVGTVYIPAGVYKLSSGISIPQFHRLLGAGSQLSILNYAGTGAAITLDSVQSSSVESLTINVTGGSATAKGISLKNTTGDCQWNRIVDTVIVADSSSPRVSGQVGIQLAATTSFSMYWNFIANNRLGYWDTSILLLGSTSPVNGASQNHLENNVSYDAVTGLFISTRSNDNTVHGLYGTAGSFAGGTQTLLKIGDGTNASGGNHVYGVVSDQGANGKAYALAANSTGNVVFAQNESGLADTDSGTNNLTVDMKAGSQATTSYLLTKKVNNIRYADQFSSIQAALTDLGGAGMVIVPAGTFTTTTISMGAGQSLIGTGSQSSIITATAPTGCVITIDSVDGVTLQGLAVNALGTSATKRGICVLNTTAATRRVTLRDLLVQGDPANPQIAGTYGIYLNATTSNSLYWTQIEHVQGNFWDTSYRLEGSTSPVNGPNSTFMTDLSSTAAITGVQFLKNAVDNSIKGIHCQSSGYTSAQTCVVIGDGVNASGGNQVYGLVSDQGTNGTPYSIAASANNNVIYAGNESTIAGSDSGSNNVVMESKSATAPSLKVGTLTTSGATVLGSSLKVATSVPGDSAGGIGFHHTRFTNPCTTAATAFATCTSATQAWNNGMGDASYDVSCQCDSSTLTGVPVIIASRPLAGGVVVMIMATTAVAATCTAMCIAMHN